MFYKQTQQGFELNKLKVKSFFISFFHESFKKAGTGFVLLLQSRNTIVRLMTTYLHRPIEILYFLRKMPKMLPWNIENANIFRSYVKQISHAKEIVESLLGFFL